MRGPLVINENTISKWESRKECMLDDYDKILLFVKNYSLTNKIDNIMQDI